jgi:hypothetical protein
VTSIYSWFRWGKKNFMTSRIIVNLEIISASFGILLAKNKNHLLNRRQRAAKNARYGSNSRSQGRMLPLPQGHAWKAI